METKEFLIEGMICSRCIKVLRSELDLKGLQIIDISLGKIILSYDEKSISVTQIESIIRLNDFEILEAEEDVVAELAKKWMISYVWDGSSRLKLSDYLSEKMPYSYATIARCFQLKENRSITDYLIHLRIERVKELIESSRNNFSEISLMLDYSNLSGLSRQFKQRTGLSLTKYASLKKSDRTPLDKI